MIDVIQNKCFFLPANQQPSLTYCTNMRQYDVYELNISTMVEISEQSIIHALHTHNKSHI